MIKRAVNLHEIRKAYAALKRGVPIVRKAVPTGGTAINKGFINSLTPSELSGIRSMGVPLVPGIYTKGEPIKLINNALKFQAAFFNRKVPFRKLRGRQREIVNRILGLHEGFEIKTPMSFAAKTQRFGSHAHPSVLLRESNIIATLPKSYKRVAQGFKELRNFGESDAMSKMVPGFEYGTTRLSRHAIRRIGNIMAKKLSKDVQESLGKKMFKKYTTGEVGDPEITEYALNKFKKKFGVV